jgi:hypothetical protein
MDLVAVARLEQIKKVMDEVVDLHDSVVAEPVHGMSPATSRSAPAVLVEVGTHPRPPSRLRRPLRPSRPAPCRSWHRVPMRGDD